MIPESISGSGRDSYTIIVGEENSCKQPLLVQSPGSWRALSKAERERDDAEEALGQGLYSLHALIGQGSFGRIHLASWRPKDAEGLDESQGAEFEEAFDHRSPTAAAAGARNEEGSRLTAAAGIRGALGSRRLGETLGAGATGFWRRRGGGGRDGPKANRTRCDRVCIMREQDGCQEEEDRVEVGMTRQPRLRALKSVCKRKVTEKGLARHIETELAVLRECSHPFIVSLSPGGQFQTSGHLHLVLDYCPGGDLCSLLGREGRLPEPQARVCAAQLALALRHLHERHIVYRDLKPENVCIDAEGRAILVDFSLARVGLDRAPGGKAMTFCGSAAYAAPEMIAREGHDTRVDLWSLGCVVYEILVGDHPFRRRRERSDRQALFDRIRHGRLNYPPHLSRRALSLLRGLLTVDPDKRLGFAPTPPSAASGPSKDQRDSQETLGVSVPPSKPPACTTVAMPDGHNIDKGEGQPGAVADANRGTGLNAEGDVVGPRARERADRPADRSLAGGVRRAGAMTLDEGDAIASGTDLSRASQLRSLGESGRAKWVDSTGVRSQGAKEPRANAKISLLLEHGFFRGLPGWGGPGTNGAWEDNKMEGSSVMVPSLRDAFDVQHFDSRFTSQPAELVLQGHPHKGGPTPSFDGFDWRPNTCIEHAQAEDRRNPGILGSMASALWC